MNTEFPGTDSFCRTLGLGLNPDCTASRVDGYTPVVESITSTPELLRVLAAMDRQECDWQDANGFVVASATFLADHCAGEAQNLANLVPDATRTVSEYYGRLKTSSWRSIPGAGPVVLAARLVPAVFELLDPVEQAWLKTWVPGAGYAEEFMGDGFMVKRWQDRGVNELGAPCLVHRDEFFEKQSSMYDW